MRLIDADALKEKSPSVFIEASCRGCPAVRGFVGLGNLINAAPTVDAVEVVRCGECKHGNPDIFLDEHTACPLMHNVMPNNGFCCYGERKGK